MKKASAIILAAGKGTRMKSDMPKALAVLWGRPMAEYLIDAVYSAGIENIVVIGGYKINLLKNELVKHRLVIARQRKLLGSAHAVSQARPFFKGFKGTVMVLYVDTPLLSAGTLKAMLSTHRKNKSDLTMLTAFLNDTKEYGTIARDEKGNIRAIVEYLDALNRPAGCPGEINAGAYCFESEKLFEGLKKIKKNKRKGEYYLTDIVEYFYRSNYRVSSYGVKDITESFGVNSRHDLAYAECVLKERNIKRIIDSGVTVKDPSSAYIAGDVKIGKGTIIYPFVVIEKGAVIGSDCKIGPFANIRAGVILKKGSTVGNYVEVVRSTIGERSRVKHHSYIGDTVIGKDVNIGAGTITANYDGRNKSRTIIEDSVFIGSGTTIVAPVRIGKKAVTGAGSVVLKGRDVLPYSVVAGVPAKPIKR
jgi:bifunctional UDP-N-acetylglucosamine pyrophosphorylase / glucosamine-1-phosphate N-acetyltransferase